MENPLLSTGNKIAVFIDAENVSHKNANRIIDFLEQKGRIIVRKIVADWTKIYTAQKNSVSRAEIINLEGWRRIAAEFSMTAVQQFTYIPKKKSSDIALAITAMKSLYEKPYIDTYCIVSNDCDFTRLAQELREQDKYVIGMGEQKRAVEEFVKAFSEYIYLDESIDDVCAEDKEATGSDSGQAGIVQAKNKANAKMQPTKTKQPAKKENNALAMQIGQEKLRYLTEIIQELIDEKGRAMYSAINGAMKNKFPDFVPQNFSCKNFRQLMETLIPILKKYEKETTVDDFALVEKKKKGGK